MDQGSMRKGGSDEAKVPKVSVVLPTRNSVKTIRSAVESILKQTFTDFELVVVDDQSTDGTREYFAELEKKDNRIVIIDNRERRGLPYALNLGIQRSRAPLVARMDADDEAFPDRLKIQYEFLCKHPTIVMTGTYALHIGKRRDQDRPVVLPTDPGRISELLLLGNCMYHSSVMYRRKEVLELGGYREEMRLAEDYDLWLRISRRYRVAIIPIPLMRYRYTITGGSNSQKWGELLYHYLAIESAKAPEVPLRALMPKAEAIRNPEMLYNCWKGAFNELVYLGYVKEAFRHGFRQVWASSDIVSRRHRLRLLRDIIKTWIQWSGFNRALFFRQLKLFKDWQIERRGIFYRMAKLILKKRPSPISIPPLQFSSILERTIPIGGIRVISREMERKVPHFRCFMDQRFAVSSKVIVEANLGRSAEFDKSPDSIIFANSLVELCESSETAALIREIGVKNALLLTAGPGDGVVLNSRRANGHHDMGEWPFEWYNLAEHAALPGSDDFQFLVRVLAGTLTNKPWVWVPGIGSLDLMLSIKPAEARLFVAVLHPLPDPLLDELRKVIPTRKDISALTSSPLIYSQLLALGIPENHVVLGSGWSQNSAPVELLADQSTSGGVRRVLFVVSADSQTWINRIVGLVSELKSADMRFQILDCGNPFLGEALVNLASHGLLSFFDLGQPCIFCPHQLGLGPSVIVLLSDSGAFPFETLRYFGVSTPRVLPAFGDGIFLSNRSSNFIIETDEPEAIASEVRRALSVKNGTEVNKKRVKNDEEISS